LPDSLGREFIHVLLHRGEGEVAEWTPSATVEGDDQGALSEELRAGTFLTHRVAQTKFRESIANLDGGIGLE
jgi:hypothetical protein